MKLLRPHKELNNNLTNQLQIINLNNGKPKKDLKYIFNKLTMSFSELLY